MLKALLLQNIRSAHNVGSILRTAACLNLEKVILVGGTPSPHHSKVLKTALGAEGLVAWHFMPDPVKAMRYVESEGYEVIALENGPESTDLAEYAPGKRPELLVVGSETDGVAPEWLSLAAARYEIPMPGAKQSFNVSVATGIALYHMLRQ